MFELSEALAQSTTTLAEWPLCSVLLKNEKSFIWFLLVPRRNNIVELTDLTISDQQLLLAEINQLSTIIENEFKPDKINIATIGNQVPQLHVHVVGRFKTDSLWPESIWQKPYRPTLYDDASFTKLVTKLKSLL
jgi:diadenosine tetraphosphate (Ap4A) HIT family hydrolase